MHHTNQFFAQILGVYPCEAIHPVTCALSLDSNELMLANIFLII